MLPVKTVYYTGFYSVEKIENAIIISFYNIFAKEDEDGRGC